MQLLINQLNKRHIRRPSRFRKYCHCNRAITSICEFLLCFCISERKKIMFIHRLVILLMAKCVVVFLKSILISLRHTVPVHFLLTSDRYFPLSFPTLLSPKWTPSVAVVLSYCRELTYLDPHRGLSGSSVTGVWSGLSFIGTSLLVSWIVRCVVWWFTLQLSQSDRRSRGRTRPLKRPDCFWRIKFSSQTVAANVSVNDSESVLFEKRKTTDN